jgi:hypothetical protein
MSTRTIRTGSGHFVSFDMARDLMDRDLLDAARKAVAEAQGHDEDAAADSQAIWDRYCALHRARHDDEFLPNRDPWWHFPMAKLEAVRAMRSPPERPSTFVMSSHGFRVDFEKACREMDPAVLAEARKDMRDQHADGAAPGTTHDAQWLWDRYCFLHICTHDIWFTPDVNPGWDLSIEETKRLIRPLPDPPEETP